MRLYPVGRGAKWLTEAQIRRLKTFALLDLEFQRRLLALMRVMQDLSLPTHFAGGWRDPWAHWREWHRRYTPVGPIEPLGDARVGAKFWNGQWWTLNPHEISLARPGLDIGSTDNGNSWHTPGPPGPTASFAADMWGNLRAMEPQLAPLGLQNERRAPGERHHVWPIEYPTGRSEFRPHRHKLTQWVLPNEHEEYNMVKRIWIAGEATQFSVDGDDALWIADGNISAALEQISGPPIIAGRLAMRQYHMSGPLPPGYTGADFASYTLHRSR